MLEAGEDWCVGQADVHDVLHGNRVVYIIIASPCEGRCIPKNETSRSDCGVIGIDVVSECLHRVDGFNG